MSNGQFTRGPDTRRNLTGGRAPSPTTMASAVRSILGRNFRARLQQLEILADAGDPAAVVACATLLAAAMTQQRHHG